MIEWMWNDRLLLNHHHPVRRTLRLGDEGVGKDVEQQIQQRARIQPSTAAIASSNAAATFAAPPRTLNE